MFQCFVTLNNATFFRVTTTDGSIETFPSDELNNVINARFAIQNDQCTSGIASSQPIFLMETLSDNFLGVYEPDPLFVIDQITANQQVKCCLLLCLTVNINAFQVNCIVKKAQGDFLIFVPAFVFLILSHKSVLLT